MEPLGQILKERGWVTEQQLADAFSRQAALGGRIGTCLLESGAIQEDLMLKVLSEQLEVPFADIEDLRNVPVEVRKLLPAGLAIQHNAVPFRASTTSVDIALLEVKDLALHDELSFVIGKKLNLHIANEARILEALDKYYGKPCSIRFIHLIERLNRERDRWKEGQKAGEAASEDPAPEASPIPEPLSPLAASTSAASRGSPKPARKPKAKPPAHRTIPVSDHELIRMGSEAPTSPGKLSTQSVADLYDLDQPRESIPVDEVEARLEHATNPEEVGRALLDFLSQKFVRVLLFQIRNGRVSGWMGSGRGVDQKRLKSYRVTLDEPSIFLNLQKGGRFFLGKLPAMAPHTQLAECWNEDLANECIVVPIRIGERLVSVVYGDRDGVGLDNLELDLIQRLVHKAGIAFKVCIMQKRQRKP